MKRWLSVVFAVVLLSATAAGVVAYQDDATPDAEMDAEASPMAKIADTTIAVSETEELGEFFTDQYGMTLYLFTVDTEPGVSACYGDCVTAWPLFVADEPLTLPEGVEGELTIIERDDGTTQVAYNDIPLYYWQFDEKPGDTTGHEVGGVWFVVAPGQEHGEQESIPQEEDEGDSEDEDTDADEDMDATPEA